MEERLNENVLEDVVGGAGGSSAGNVKVVNCDYVNIRNATRDGAVIGQIKCGTVVSCSGFTNGWAHVTYRGVTGYIYKDYYTKV